MLDAWNWQKHDYDDIPGTYVFDGETANSAYALNKMLYSFNNASGRDEFESNPAAYADKFGLSDAQKQALLEGDILQLLRLGANIYLLAKFAVPRGMTMQDTGAAFQGITRDEFQAGLDAKADCLVEKLKAKGGFWNG